MILFIIYIFISMISKTLILKIFLYNYSNKNNRVDFNIDNKDINKYSKLYYYNNFDTYWYIKPWLRNLWSTEKTDLDNNNKNKLTCKNLEKIIQKEGNKYHNDPDGEYLN